MVPVNPAILLRLGPAQFPPRHSTKGFGQYFGGIYLFRRSVCHGNLKMLFQISSSSIPLYQHEFHSPWTLFEPEILNFPKFLHTLQKNTQMYQGENTQEKSTLQRPVQSKVIAIKPKSLLSLIFVTSRLQNLQDDKYMNNIRPLRRISMSRLIQSISLATLIVTLIPLRGFATPILIAQRQPSQSEQTHQNPVNSSLRRDTTPQTTPTTPATSTLQRGQDNQLLPPIDAEFGFKATFGKCSAVEIIGPDGTCIPTPIPE